MHGRGERAGEAAGSACRAGCMGAKGRPQEGGAARSRYGLSASGGVWGNLQVSCTHACVHSLCRQGAPCCCLAMLTVVNKSNSHLWCAGARARSTCQPEGARVRWAVSGYPHLQDPWLRYKDPAHVCPLLGSHRHCVNHSVPTSICAGAAESCVTVRGTRKIEANVPGRMDPYAFMFDQVLPEETSQREVFEGAGASSRTAAGTHSGRCWWQLHHADNVGNWWRDLARGCE